MRGRGAAAPPLRAARRAAPSARSAWPCASGSLGAARLAPLAPARVELGIARRREPRAARRAPEPRASARRLVDARATRRRRLPRRAPRPSADASAQPATLDRLAEHIGERAAPRRGCATCRRRRAAAASARPAPARSCSRFARTPYAAPSAAARATRARDSSGAADQVREREVADREGHRARVEELRAEAREQAARARRRPRSPRPAGAPRPSARRGRAAGRASRAPRRSCPRCSRARSARARDAARARAGPPRRARGSATTCWMGSVVPHTAPAAPGASTPMPSERALRVAAAHRDRRSRAQAERLGGLGAQRAEARARGAHRRQQRRGWHPCARERLVVPVAPPPRSRGRSRRPARGPSRSSPVRRQATQPSSESTQRASPSRPCLRERPQPRGASPIAHRPVSGAPLQLRAGLGARARALERGARVAIARGEQRAAVAVEHHGAEAHGRHRDAGHLRAASGLRQRRARRLREPREERLEIEVGAGPPKSAQLRAATIGAPPARSSSRQRAPPPPRSSPITKRRVT